MAAKKTATAPRTTRASKSNGVEKTTAVRNSALPKAQPAARREVTHDMIARRAFEISQSPECRSDCENWLRAERELRGA